MDGPAQVLGADRRSAQAGARRRDYTPNAARDARSPRRWNRRAAAAVGATVSAAVGYRLGVARLRIGELLGQGAVGRVVLVHDDDDGRVLAGKLLHASHRSDAAAAARFAQEARITAVLRHPNIVVVHGIVAIDDDDVLLMEYVDGPTLAVRIAREAPMREDDVIALAQGIATGLAHAHGHGVVHRDLKPANILIAGAVPKIADFGMARGSAAGDDEPAIDARASALAVLGTPDYMAPECLDPLAVDGRADLYALGCIMFEMLVGRPPFTGATPHAVLRAHRDDDPPALPDSVSPALRELVAALLAKSPGRRPQAASVVAEALGRAARGQPIALARRGDGHLRCSACGRVLVAGVGACLSCGQALLDHAPGRWSVIVVGPGEVGDKLDSTLRERLCGWLVAQPDLGLGPNRALARRIPRLPFTLATGLGQPQAEAIAAAIAELGLEAQATGRSALGLAPMRKKAATLSGRVGLVALTSSAGFISTGPGLVIGIAATVAMVVATTIVSARRVTRRVDATPPLPEAIRGALRRTVSALGEIVSPRHREALRAVVERAAELGRDAAFGGDSEIADELARAIDAATAAAATLERLDRALVGPRLGGQTDAARDLLRSRDLWASRLQAVLAELDAARDRIVDARTRMLAGATRDALGDLRAHVEALEEVQR